MAIEAPREVVDAWQRAVSAGDIEAALRLSSPDIEVGGPRGTTRGHQLVREWVARTNIHLTPIKTHALGTILVVEQRALWRDATGAVSSEALIATLFEVRDGLVVRAIRFDDVARALKAVGIDTP